MTAAREPDWPHMPRAVSRTKYSCIFGDRKKTAGEVFINDPIDTDNEGNTLSIIDIISDNETIIDDIDLKIKTDRLYEYVKSSLSPREQIIITLRYGLYGEIPLTQREIASRLKISRSYVSRIEKKSSHNPAKAVRKACIDLYPPVIVLSGHIPQPNKREIFPPARSPLLCHSIHLLFNQYFRRMRTRFPLPRRSDTPSIWQ